MKETVYKVVVKKRPQTGWWNTSGWHSEEKAANYVRLINGAGGEATMRKGTVTWEEV